MWSPCTRREARRKGPGGRPGDLTLFLQTASPKSRQCACVCVLGSQSSESHPGYRFYWWPLTGFPCTRKSLQVLDSREFGGICRVYSRPCPYSPPSSSSSSSSRCSRRSTGRFTDQATLPTLAIYPPKIQKQVLRPATDACLHQMDG